ncbi:putative amino acid transporter aATP11 [Leptomonas pyrrhocoris]|uniref:Putative amino acid transporter aATP11 n=1 Tax=Leptomonas pyrrhocoris TaxID=157538 RepID=A0A0N0DZR8_LEPPY|nr:putative amino acid transporter aATP11 [Leptomonas pyrrhocoris]XP_015664048.1 putative amino acid transporter aATP11 [Leptomonas pyrrhocoris]XP_015664049.1 putative amino acid transporter aATP11 [Leptomonas pyrrhocoris]KPA85608.1 putative amino acid transporter aATP11 [Leptomonas pyrrhocoris]KPA85609.1 putative amino acid transporter aATP11 [Leptomonas pyrrhocoris]KPA85610.1 putative amino acid transporter aATP11 [Leptomonas pyrrhocoris]|eukprot:XP_015664047.1 putative amino acid transporter aATP11 [Leptomonas pyrrhocoris]
MSRNTGYVEGQDEERAYCRRPSPGSQGSPINPISPKDVMATKVDREMEGTFEQVDELGPESKRESGRAMSPPPPPTENCIFRLTRRIMPPGGLASGVFNLASGSMGAGILGLPAAFQSSGVITGTILLIIVFFMTVYTMRLLALVYEKTGIRGYELTARYLFGRGGDIFTAVIMFLKCIGACIAYVTSVGDLWHAFLNDDRVPERYQSDSFQRVLTSVTFVVLMLPLSLPRQINTLRYFSLFGVTFILFFVVCLTVHSATHGLKNGNLSKVKLFNTGNAAMGGLGQFVFAFLCQSNAYQVFNETTKPSVRFFELQCFISMLICTVFYWLTAFFAYADFGDRAGTPLLRLYRPLTDYYLAVAYVGIAFKLCVAFALHILPCRDAVHHLVGWDIRTVAWWKNALLCTFLSLVSLLCGLFIPNVNIASVCSAPSLGPSSPSSFRRSSSSTAVASPCRRPAPSTSSVPYLC